MTSSQPSPQKSIFDVFGKNFQKISGKTFIEKSILLKFVNLSPIFFCPVFSEETYFQFYLGPDHFILHFLKILVFEKAHLLFKLILKATQLQEIP